jgi:lipopolysaccharide export system permease protein
MKINSILNRYIFRELFAPFGVILIFFTFVFMMAEMLKITNLIVNYSVGLFTILQILALSTPFFFMFVIPMSVMMAILLTFLRMSSDNEIIAMKTGGVNLYRLLPPVFIFCLGAYLLTFFFTAFGAPKAQEAIKDLTYRIFSQNIEIGLKPRTFNDSFKDVMLYINDIDIKNRHLIDVFIEDKRQKDLVTTVVAPRGILFKEKETLVYHLRLFDGRINQVSLENRSANSVTFKTYDVRLDLEKALSNFERMAKRWKVMTLPELKRYLKDAGNHWQKKNMLVRFHNIIAMPFACFALGILAVPLGIQSRSEHPSLGLVVGLVFFLIYYLLLSAGHILGESGRVAAPLAIWAPNVVMGAFGLFLLIGSARERSVRIAAPIYRLWHILSRMGDKTP